MSAEGFDEFGYDQWGFDRHGHDREGYDREGLSHDGYDRAGIDADGYDRAGFNRYGYDRTGHHRSGHRAPEPAPPVTAEQAARGLVSGVMATAVVSGLATALAAWAVRRIARMWELPERFGSPPEAPSPAAAAAWAVLGTVLGCGVMVGFTLTLAAPADTFRLLVALCGLSVLVVSAGSSGAATWLGLALIIAPPVAVIGYFAPTLAAAPPLRDHHR